MMALFAKERLQPVPQNVERRTVLLVDDEDANLRAMEAILRSHYQILQAHDGNEALQLLKNLKSVQNLACIISDQRMPQLSGVEFFQHAYQHAPHTIRIVVTGYSDLDAIISSINKAEIFKFIVKPFDAEDFLQTVEKAVELFEMKQQLQDYYQELENKVKQRTEELERKNAELEQAQLNLSELTITDSLTQLRNRRFLLQRMDADVAISLRRYEEWQKRGCPGAPQDMDLVFFFTDLYHFTRINSMYGQAAGDAILCQIRGRLQEVFRESDYLVRWGGTQFLVVARATNRCEAGVVAERIRMAIGGRNFVLSNNQSLPLSCSIGFASFPFVLHDMRALPWAQVVNLAEQAMLLSKEGGHNTWVGLYATEHTRANDVIQFVMRDSATAVQDGQIQIVRSLTESDR